MKTIVLEKQQKHPVHIKKVNRLADWLGTKLAERTAPLKWNEVSVVLTNDQGITATNAEYFGKNRPTDVISFRYDPIPGEDDGLSGDLVINVERAVQIGAAHQGINYELALYIAHGFDHLSGADDNTPEKRRKMRATETAWLNQAAAEGLIDNLLIQEAK